MKIICCIVFAITILLLGITDARSDGKRIVKVDRWAPHDFEFSTASGQINPFAVNFSAEITGPGNIKLKLPGFYDGNNTWKIRFSPSKEGNWHIEIRSDVSSLNDQQAEVLCVKDKHRNNHGGLLVDPKNPHHFVYEDGTHWFPIGYECNWLWAVDANDNKLPVINSFIDKLKQYNFNYILINTYCYDTKWRQGKSEVDDYGPSSLYPWEGNNQYPDFSHFNLAYWRHFDQVIESMYQHGMVAHLYLKVYNKEVNWMKNGSVEDDRYYRWIIARYAAYPNIIWDLAKEANNEKSVEYKTGRLKFIRATDPYHRLLTVHTDIETYDKGFYNGLVDFRSHQEQSNHLHATTIKQLAQNSWPVFNVESGYEYGPKGPGDKTYSHVNSPEDVAKYIWEIQMAGGYNAYYYTFTAWDVIRYNDKPIGYTYVKNFSDFFSNTKYWLLKSADSIVSKGYCLANTGKEYVVFQKGTSGFELNLKGLSKSLNAKWYQPFTGKYCDAGMLTNGKIELTPPKALGNGPVVLYISDDNH